jgi:hypothetical protein
LHAQLEQFAGMLRRILPENIDLRVDLRATVTTIAADPAQVDQLLLNFADPGALGVCRSGIDFLTKPFTMEQLSAKVAALVEQGRQGATVPTVESGRARSPSGPETSA